MSEHTTLRQWTDVVRRARLGRTVKAVAMVLATYADSNGQRVFPGVARLAWECEINYNTAQGALAELRRVQLIELVREGGRRGGKRRDADEYRLTLGVDLLELVEVPTPGQAEVAIERIRQAKQGRNKQRPHPSAQGAVADESHPAAMGAVEADRTHPHGVQTDTTAPIGAGTTTPTAPSRNARPHPSALGPNSHDRDTTAIAHSGEEGVTTSHGPRVREAEANPEFGAEVIDLDARRAALAPAKCGHSMQAGNRPDGKPNCPICRALGVVSDAVIPSPRGAPA